jgi:hypothetical protein
MGVYESCMGEVKFMEVKTTTDHRRRGYREKWVRWGKRG